MMSYGYLSAGKDFHMNKKNHNQKHLTLSDRVYIEQELLQGTTFRSIANTLHKDPSTISEEIRLHAMMPKTTSFKTPRCKQCRYYDSCKIASISEHLLYRKVLWDFPIQKKPLRISPQWTLSFCSLACITIS